MRCFEKRKRRGKEGELVTMVKLVEKRMGRTSKEEEETIRRSMRGCEQSNYGFCDVGIFGAIFLHTLHTYRHRPLTRHAI
jgi:hypothetical protein